MNEELLKCLTAYVRVAHISGMHLREYLRLTGQNVHGFALKHGLKPSTLNRLANGRTFPSVPTLDVIVEATGGAVTANDFYAALPRKGRAA